MRGDHDGIATDNPVFGVSGVPGECVISTYDAFDVPTLCASGRFLGARMLERQLIIKLDNGASDNFCR
jgi:hypothetical protein